MVYSKDFTLVRTGPQSWQLFLWNEDLFIYIWFSFSGWTWLYKVSHLFWRNILICAKHQRGNEVMINITPSLLWPQNMDLIMWKMGKWRTVRPGRMWPNSIVLDKGTHGRWWWQQDQNSRALLRFRWLGHCNHRCYCWNSLPHSPVMANNSK